jgi:mannosyl-3-phosphoglycerate phosphatase
MSKIVIITDLDGSLLDPVTYSFEEAGEALEEIRQRRVPLVFCSSKTRAEIEDYRERLGNSDPFISENGGGIFIPEGYFSHPPEAEVRTGYHIVTLGTPYREIRERFTDLRRTLGVRVRGFGDMDPDEIAALAGVPRDEAVLAKQREFDEPFAFEGDPDERFLGALEEMGLRWTQGRFFHVMGKTDKGRAARLLRELYERESGKISVIGLGDGFNDLPLLKESDHAVLIPREDGSFDPRVVLPHLVRAKGIGPVGWDQAVRDLLREWRE